VGVTIWTRNLFGASLVFAAGVTILAERLPAWWGPTSILALMLTASAFLTCSILDYRRGRAAVSTVQE
jgi:hypothetical protein